MRARNDQVGSARASICTMNRCVLIVTPFFAPQNHAAVFRAYKLAQYLPQYGWKPIVLTVDTQYEYNEDPELLTRLPAEVEIVKARYIEPTFRGVRMALGGRNRTFLAMKVAPPSGPDGKIISQSPLHTSLLLRTYNYLLSHYVQVPDAFWTWASAAIVVGKKLLSDRNIPLVFTTASPYSSLAIGRSLQRAGAKWVCDFRDPLTYTQRLSSEVSRVYHRQRNMVRSALENADAVTVLSSCYGSIYSDMFGSCGANTVFIPTGIDTELLEESAGAEGHRPYLIFTGEFLPDYDDTFFEAFAAALGRTSVKRIGLKLLVVGTLQLNRTRLMPLVERLGLNEHIEFWDQMPQREVYRLVSRARAGVLLPGSRAYWWTSFAKMADFIGMRKPVVAVVPDPSEARSALTRSRLGVFLDGSAAECADKLTQFVLGEYRLPSPNESECDRYTVRQQVRSFAGVFDRVSSSL